MVTIYRLRDLASLGNSIIHELITCLSRIQHVVVEESNQQR